MRKLTDREIEAMARMSLMPEWKIVEAVLKDELDLTVKSLINNANPAAFQTSQGKAQTLTDVLETVNLSMEIVRKRRGG